MFSDYVYSPRSFATPRPSVSFLSEAKNLECRGLLEDDMGGGEQSQVLIVTMHYRSPANFSILLYHKRRAPSIIKCKNIKNKRIAFRSLHSSYLHLPVSGNEKRQGSFCEIFPSVKKRATPAGACSPIAVKTVSKRYKRQGSFYAISYSIKKRRIAADGCSPIAVFLISKQCKRRGLI